jgi:hypothetical protein
MTTGTLRLSTRQRTAAATRGLSAAIVSSPLVMGQVSSDAGALYGALLARLIAANAGLRGLVGTESATAQLMALLDVTQPWEAAVTPLALRDAEAAWEGVAAGGARAHDSAYVMGLLDELADNYGFHIVRDEAAPGGGEIWPVTAAQVVFAGAGRTSVAALVEAAASVLAPVARLIATAEKAVTVAHAVEKAATVATAVGQ